MSIQKPEAVDEFAEQARIFCSWGSENSSGDSAIEALAVTLANLIAAGFRLGWSEGIPTDKDKQLEVPEFFREAALALPFRYYSEIFNTLVVPPEDPVVGDLIDDILDIYSDLIPGLEQYDQGNKSIAADHWRFWLHHHWGEHATSATRAIWSFLANRDGVPDTGGP